MPVILASQSPWRKKLLARHGIFCKIQASGFCEIKSHSRPIELVRRNAIGKALAVAKHVKNATIIGVDTIGVLKGEILGKPRNREGARRMLKKLFGNTHRVITGLCVMNLYKKFTAVVTTRVTFRKATSQELENYLDSGEWKGKAGSYAIQGRAKKFVQKIEGDVTNVVGVPIKRLKQLLSL